MGEAGSPKLLFDLVDFKPIRGILWVGLHLNGPGRPVVYGSEWDLRALMLRMLLQLSTQNNYLIAPRAIKLARAC